MFARIVPRYDFLNHLLSFSLDRLWRRRVAARFRQILSDPEKRALDLCCGTGDLTLALARAGGKEARRLGSRECAAVFGSDFVHAMLVRALEKSIAAAPERVRYIEGDALSAPFADASFDLVTLAFGFRNLANYERGLREIWRLLRPGGEVGILEFSKPRGAVFGRLYRFYFTRIIPRLGGAISGSAEAYSYLPSSVAQFPSPEELLALMQCVGFTGVRYEVWTGGSVAFHTARR